VGETEGYWPGPPDLAVEVLSPSDNAAEVETKVLRWLSYETKQVWVVNSELRIVQVYRSPTDIATFTELDYLEAADILPGFRIALVELFEL
jgi:Uma2 family endonuclease